MVITSDPVFCKYVKVVIPDKSDLFNEHMYIVCTYDEKEEIVDTITKCKSCPHKQPLERN